MPPTRRLAGLVAATLVLTACGDDAGGGDRPTIAVTTTILGDVVGELVGDQAEVVTIMPVGADPHDFSASAQQANQMREADVLVVNGAGFEEGLTDVIDAATEDGAPTFEAIDAVETIEFGGSGHSDQEEHSDEGGDEHDHEGADPHFFTDPARMAVAAAAVADELTATVPGLDDEALRARAAAYVAELEAVDAAVEGIVADIGPDDRVLVTNHEVFGYFADRYGFDVVGTVIPSGSTSEGVSAGELADLAATVEATGVPAVFADTSSPDDLARALADEVGDVAVVELYSESLGEPGSEGDTYVRMVRTNARRIADALG